MRCAEKVQAAYELGQRDERERIRTGVTGLRAETLLGCAVHRNDVIAVIDGGQS